MDAGIVGQQGVHFVEGWALRQGWYFRPITIFDVGIDAELELRENDRATGRLIAIQIKAGPTYFSSPTADGWFHPVTNIHAAYWLDHSLPVIIVLVDLQTNTGYWQLVDKSTLVATGKHFKIEVPRANELGLALPEWSAIAHDQNLEAAVLFEPNLAVLPPGVSAKLRDALAEDRNAPLLALQLATRRFDVAALFTDLLSSPPSWMPVSAGRLWRIAALFAFEHGEYLLAAEALVRGAQTAESPADQYLQAGHMLIDVDPDLARHHLEEARARGGESFGADLLGFLLDNGSQATRIQAEAAELDLSGADALLNVHAQFFASQVDWYLGDFDRAVQHSQMVADITPESSGGMLQLAQAFLRRSRASSAQLGDIQRAVSIGIRALDQRHEWSGPTAGFLEFALQALSLAGDYSEVYRRSLPSPEGLATSEEASRADVARMAIVSGALIGDSGHRDQIVERVSDVDARALLQVEFPAAGEIVEPARRVALWKKRLDTALESHNLNEVDQAVRVLALDGVDESTKLERLIAEGAITEALAETVRAVALSTTDLEGALPALRSLALDDVGAAHYLSLALARAGRFADAAEACADAATRFSTVEFLTEEVHYLRSANDPDQAQRVAERAMTRSDFVGRDRAELARFLQMRAFQRRDWQDAQAQGLEALASLGGVADPEIVWNVVGAMLNQELREDAARLIRANDLAPESNDEVAMWLVAFPSEEWDRISLAEAVTLAIKFEGDVNVSAALLGRIASSGSSNGETNGADTSDLHVRGMEMLAAHVARFGDQSPIKSIPGDVEGIIQMVRTQAEQVQAPIKAATLLARQGRIPLGAYANSLHRPYSFVYLQMPLGSFPAGAFPDEAHEMEVTIAMRSVGGKVSVDSSPLLLNFLLDEARSVRGQFQQVLLHPAAAADMHAGIAELQRLAASAGSMGWDARQQRPTYIEYTDDDRAKLLSTARVIKNAIPLATVTERIPLATPPLAGLPDEAASWAGPVEVAIARGVALWSDDAALRALAAALQVETFGTPALFEALARRGIETASDRFDAHASQLEERILRLARAGVSDVQIPPAALRDMATEEVWSGALASVPLSRPSWWAWNQEPLREMRDLLVSAEETNASATAIWRWRAMLGAAITRWDSPQDAATLVAAVALVPIRAVPTIEDAKAGVELARELAIEMDLPDPADFLALAADLVATAGLLADPANYLRLLFSVL
ncbi:MAG: hypothetical protein JWP19_416 [Rhodoglobus sp.]|nr:hypothetical protein [Rhodoglobus sp.]